jgi:diaminopimelate decarboxylase
LDNIYSYINKYFKEEINNLEIIMEPGSILTKDIGVIVSEVTLVARKSMNIDDVRWVYLDIGKYG